MTDNNETTDKPTDIKDFKKKKKLKKIVEDLKMVIKVYNLSINALKS